MCGIAGIISEKPGANYRELVKKATACLAHRGPDEEKFWSDPSGKAALGHRRLSIIDLSAAAGQPMVYLDRFHIACNGEIYNYRELRSELERKGFAFSTASDTEVILAAYAAYGRDCVNHFEGMFAFVIWDSQLQELFAARDRMGEKPFYYTCRDGQLYFASEIRAMFRMGLERRYNPRMIFNFLSIGYTSNPGNPGETFFENISKLPAASTLYWRPGYAEPVIEKYWLPYISANDTMTDEMAVAEFTRLFADSVRRRLRSDVPVGTSLSGGLDSSSVVAFIHRVPRESLGDHYTHSCFTACFEGFEHNEREYARQVADHFSLEHHITTIEPGEVVELMERAAAMHDIPFASASPLVQFRVYEMAASRNMKVLLDGQGADELLAGYHKYYFWYWQELFRRRILKQSGELQAAMSKGIRQQFGIRHRLASIFPDLAMSVHQGRLARKAAAHAGLHPVLSAAAGKEIFHTAPVTPDLNGALYHSSFVQGLEELLLLADRNSMAHSLEVRLPFLDYQLVEFLFTLPPSFKIREGWTKWLLRKAVENMLPENIVWRKDKTGFEPPQKKWMQQPDVQEAIHAARKKLVEMEILDREILDKKIQPHDSYVAENRDWKHWSIAALLG